MLDEKPAEKPAAAIETPRYRVLLIGIDQYPDQPLQGCVNDIDAFEALLREQLGVPEAAITKLVAPDRRTPPQAPTKERIVEELRRLAGAEVQPGDRVIVYYAGHGTQRYFSQAETNYEAIVPVDHGGDPSRLLFDFELNPILQQIIEKAQDVTLILDCCNSAGVSRFAVFEDEPLPGRARFLSTPDHADKPLPTPPEGALRGPSLATPELLSRCTILSAAQADELAEEVDAATANGTSHGALSFCLLELLRGELKGREQSLRWSELWGPLRLRLRQLSSGQTPDLLGSIGRRVFGGPAEPFDAGLAVRALDDGSFEIDGGELAGLGPGAVVAVYGPEQPRTFFPIGSEADQAARIGQLFVCRSDARRAIAKPQTGTMLALPLGARGRLDTLGSLGRLRLSIAPGTAAFVTALVQTYSGENGFLKLCDAADPDWELRIAQSASGDLHLGDRSCGTDPAVPPGPMATIALLTRQDEDDARRTARMSTALLAALRHYATYLVPLRLAKLAQRPDSSLQPGALDFIAVDGGDDTLRQAMQHDVRRVRELRKDPSGRYPVTSGAPVCFRVHNMSWSRLFVALAHCDSRGRVQLLTPPQQLSPSTGAFLWPAGTQTGQPYTFELGDRPLAIERFIAIATNSPEAAFRWLPASHTLQEVIDAADQAADFDRQDDDEPPTLEWTALQLALELHPS